MPEADQRLDNTGKDDPVLLFTCATVAALGGLLAIVGNIAGSIVVPGHDFVADTISNLGAGRYEWIQDFALYGFAAALTACALGAANLHGGDRRWTVGIVSLAILCGIVTIIGARNEYGDGDTGGVVIHIYLVYALGALFPLVFFSMARGLSRADDDYGKLSLFLGGLWIIAAPIFFILPTGWDGLWERGLGLICIFWTWLMAQFLFESGRRAS